MELNIKLNRKSINYH